MPETGPAQNTTQTADSGAGPRALPARVDELEAAITCIGTAASVYEVLPAVLARLGGVLGFNRTYVAETGTAEEGRAGEPLLFQWTAGLGAPPAAADPGLPIGVLRRLLERPVSGNEPVQLCRSSAPAELQPFMAAHGALRSVLVPLQVDGRAWGLIGFEDAGSEQAWPDEVVRSLAMLAQILGAGILREHFRQQACQREQLLQAVTRCAAHIGAAQNLHEALDRALATLGAAVGVDRMLLVQLTDEDAEGRRHAVLRNYWNGAGISGRSNQIIHDTALARHPDVTAWMLPLNSGAPVEAQQSRAQAGVRELLQRLQTRSSLLVPIMVNGRYWGHIGLDACHHERRWSGADVDVLRILADMIGAAITRERHVTELARAETIVQNSPTVLYRLRGEPQLPMIYVSRNIERIGFRQHDLLATPTLYRSLIHPADRERVMAALELLLRREGSGGRMEFRMINPQGEVHWFEGCYTPVRDDAGHLLEIEGILIDISERKSAEASIALLARTDPLTGLANRMIFGEQLRQAFASAQRGGRAFAVLYLDLDRFKEVNDTLGHHAGDRLLQEVGRRLRDVTREIDLVARLGGDEFAIVQAGIDDSTAAGTLAEKLIEIVSAPYVIEGNELRIGVSIGISLYDAQVRSPDDLLMMADQALYRAKHAGRGQYRFHSDEIDHEVRAQMTLAEDLRSALARQELEMRYQPQVALSSGRIVGMEALLRWNHPTRGMLLPEDFLPIAEKYGLMQQLGRWTVDTACRQMSLWRAASMPVPVIAINVSLAQIKMGREFVRDVMDSIARWGITPADIELDVTELVLARSTLAQSNVLDQLRRVGVGIAIDNFGSQYSSLDYLRTYRVSRLKIARGMIAAADVEPGGVAMVRAILSLAAELGIDVVAEGVETETQRRLIVQASQEAQGQGFFFSRPVSAEDTMPMLRAGIVDPAGEPGVPTGTPDPFGSAAGKRAAASS